MAIAMALVIVLVLVLVLVLAIMMSMEMALVLFQYLYLHLFHVVMELNGFGKPGFVGFYAESFFSNHFWPVLLHYGVWHLPLLMSCFQTWKIK